MLEALAEKEDGRSVFAGFMGPPPPFTDEELAASATARLLEGVDFRFVPDFVEKRLHGSWSGRSRRAGPSGTSWRWSSAEGGSRRTASSPG